MLTLYKYLFTWTDNDYTIEYHESANSQKCISTFVQSLKVVVVVIVVCVHCVVVVFVADVLVIVTIDIVVAVLVFVSIVDPRNLTLKSLNKIGSVTAEILLLMLTLMFFMMILLLFLIP